MVTTVTSKDSSIRTAIIKEEPNEVRNIGKEKGRGRYANDVDVTAGKRKDEYV